MCVYIDDFAEVVLSMDVVTIALRSPIHKPSIDAIDIKSNVFYILRCCYLFLLVIIIYPCGFYLYDFLYRMQM